MEKERKKNLVEIVNDIYSRNKGERGSVGQGVESRGVEFGHGRNRGDGVVGLGITKQTVQDQ